MTLSTSRNPQKFPEIFLKLFRMHFLIVNILSDCDNGNLKCMKLYADVLQIIFSLMSILRALKSVSYAISSNSQSFLRKAIGAPLCLPLLLKPSASPKESCQPAYCVINLFPPPVFGLDDVLMRASNML